MRTVSRPGYGSDPVPGRLHPQAFRIRPPYRNVNRYETGFLIRSAYPSLAEQACFSSAG